MASSEGLKVKIDSKDGLPANTRVVLEDGTPLHYVRSIQLRIDAAMEEVPSVQVEFILPMVEVESMRVTVSEDHLRDLAAAHGFLLVRRPLSADRIELLVAARVAEAMYEARLAGLIAIDEVNAILRDS